MSKKNYIIPIFIPHQGCPHDCSFCNQKKIAGEIEDVTEKEVYQLIDDYLNLFPKDAANKEVAFYGGSFTGIPIRKQLELLKPAFKMKKKGCIHAIRVSTRPDYIDKDRLDLLKSYGVSAIELGVQSTDDEILALNRRGHKREDVFYAAELIKGYGFRLGLQMMVGLIGDHSASIHQTAKDIISLKPNFVRIYPTMVIKDTHLEALYYQGEYTPFSFEETVAICKELLLQFQANHIPVIRLGLQNTEDISHGKTIVAGPYHPAFREIVEGEIYKDLIEEKLKSVYEDREAMLLVYCHPSIASKVAGFKQGNKKYFAAKYKISKMIIKHCLEMPKGEIRISLIFDRNL
ncbi:elongator complex protein 3 [Clostridium formicaceticum]|uniref:Oxygen-independent coproporphyrinogen-III oxidase 1 n=1 Tax=Clostridium formicaceticum TaxID=1497 RepID=A0AAC9RM87_9CLOT|nr:radical SAM protein [Clostridium formicaceticum]AOY77344.1 radical SAM protein [Clostridium formicaceticum]ARE87888.1 Oxygen-independent coproporphyrinogen-III oxidase 1 [Clostridium formicaceticum]